MRKFAQIRPSFWHGTTGRQIRRFGSECQVLALYLISGPSAQALGLYYLPLTTAAHETGLTFEQVCDTLIKLKEINFCEYDYESEVVFVLNMARFQIGERLAPRDKNVVWVGKELAKLRGLPFFDLLVEMYAEPYQIADYFRSDRSAKPLRSIESEKRDLETDRNSEIGDGNGSREGRGVMRGNPANIERSIFVDRETQTSDLEALEAQRHLETRRAMNRRRPQL